MAIKFIVLDNEDCIYYEFVKEEDIENWLETEILVGVHDDDVQSVLNTFSFFTVGKQFKPKFKYTRNLKLNV